MFYCRTHGEPLQYNAQLNRWECPEIAVCHTYVNDEAIYRFPKIEDMRYFERFDRLVTEFWSMPFAHGDYDLIT